MTIYQKIICIISVIAIVFLLAWLLHRLALKNWVHKYSNIINASLSRALVYISFIISAYFIIRILNLPEYQLI